MITKTLQRKIPRSNCSSGPFSWRTNTAQRTEEARSCQWPLVSVEAQQPRAWLQRLQTFAFSSLFVRCYNDLIARRNSWSHHNAHHIFHNCYPVTSLPFTATNLPIRFSIDTRRPVTSLLFSPYDDNEKRRKFQRPWHDPMFMSDSSPEEVEAWLLSLLKSAQNVSNDGAGSGYFSHQPKVNFHEHFRSGGNNNNYPVDASAYLRVLEAHSRIKTNKKGGMGGAPQKAEYWIGRLERHYAAAVESFRTAYGNDCVENVDEHKARVIHEFNDESFSLHPSSNEKYSPFAKLVSSRKKSTSSPPISTGDIEKDSTETKLSETSRNSQRDNAAAIVRRLQPTIECYNAVIEAWANDTNPISVVRSRRWLSKLEDEAKNAKNLSGTTSDPLVHAPLQPNARSYDLYLHSCSRGIGKQNHLYKQRAEEAEEILRYRMLPSAPSLIRPTTESFNYVLRAWTRCRKEKFVAERVMMLVREMEGIQREVLLNEEKGYRGKDENDDWTWKRNIVPNTKTYTIAMDAWICVAGWKADRWYSDQREYSNTHNQSNKRQSNGKNNDNFGGNREYTNMKTGKDDDRNRNDDNKDDGTKEMDRAKSILKYIHALQDVGHTDVHATVIAYNTLLSGWAQLANEYRPDIPLKSEALLHEMLELREAGNENAAPDVTSFNAVSMW